MAYLNNTNIDTSQISTPGRQVNLIKNSGFGVCSQSTLENVTGTNLVLNGDCETSPATEWTYSGSGSHANEAGTVHGGTQSLRNTLGAAGTGFSYQILTTEAGKLYQYSVWLYAPTVGGLTSIGVMIGTGAQVSDIVALTTSATKDAWVQFTGVFVAVGTSTYLQARFEGVNAEYGFLDDASCFEVTPGFVAADNNAFDGDVLGSGWNKNVNQKVYREHQGVNTKEGSFYSCKILGDGNLGNLRVSTVNNMTLSYVQGRTMTFGCWMKTSTSSHANIYLGDSISNVTDYHTGSGNWEWLEVTLAVDVSTTSFSIAFQNTTALDDVYISQPMLIFGDYIGEGNYVPIPNEIINLNSDVSLNGYTGSGTISSNITIDIESMTNGKIPKYFSALETQVSSAGTIADTHYLSFRSSVSNGTGQILSRCQVSGIRQVLSAWVKILNPPEAAITVSGTQTSVNINFRSIRL